MCKLIWGTKQLRLPSHWLNWSLKTNHSETTRDWILCSPFNSLKSVTNVFCSALMCSSNLITQKCEEILVIDFISGKAAVLVFYYYPSIQTLVDCLGYIRSTGRYNLPIKETVESERSRNHEHEDVCYKCTRKGCHCQSKAYVSYDRFLEYVCRCNNVFNKCVDIA